MKISKGYIVSGTLLGLALSLIVFVLGYSFIILNNIHYTDQGETIPIETNLDQIEAPDNMKEGMKIPVFREDKVWNVLLIGSDAADGGAYGRSDAMILMTVNEKTGNIHLTSLMRAIYVSIPNEPDPRYANNYSPNYMLNAAHTWGGPELLLKTVQRNFRVDVPKYVAVDFNGFTEVIDAIGGVTINLTQAEASYLGMSAGPQWMNGAKALEYSRIRKLDSDFYRMGRQRTVIAAIIDKMRTVDVVTLAKTAEAIAPSLSTNYSRGELLGIISRAPTYQKYGMDELMLPVEEYDAMVYINGMEMYNIDWSRNINALHEHMSR
ncbi:MAG: LCP family protein [Eubacteriales bacterium]|nr:LCP family protein [Eubacteriales bacterium]MDD4324076.1 LCP family protein [Eubacteriales bacterium]MDD4541536.1 LCP family protein [Eubacteriales bacterium]